MEKSLKLNAGQWWRFGRYVLRRGVIRPEIATPCAEYNPWAGYEAAWGHRRVAGKTAPYHSLIELADDYERGAQAGLKRRALEQRVLQWCAENGLLGVLLQRTLQVTLAPRWVKAQKGPADEQARDLMAKWRRNLKDTWGVSVPPAAAHTPRSALVRVLTHDVCVSGNWSRQRREFARALAPQSGVREGQLVDDADRPAEWPATGQALIRDLHGGPWTLEPLATTWGRFFPSVPPRAENSFVYPEPLSDEFWKLYAEPVDEFVEAAVLFRDAIRGALQFKQLGRASRTAASRAIDGWWHKLRALYSQGGILLVPDQGNYSGHIRWVASSLLGTFAIMALQDIAEGRLKSCVVCSRLFLAAPRARYCSERCRDTRSKRSRRARVRAPQAPRRARGIRKPRKARR